MEEPFPPEAIEDYRRLCDFTSLRIAAGEQDVGRWTFRRLIWDAHLDVIQPDISRVGGLTEAKRIAYMAHEVNRVCVPHAFRTGVSGGGLSAFDCRHTELCVSGVFGDGLGAPARTLGRTFQSRARPSGCSDEAGVGDRD